MSHSAGLRRNDISNKLFSRLKQLSCDGQQEFYPALIKLWQSGDRNFGLNPVFFKVVDSFVIKDKILRKPFQADFFPKQMYNGHKTLGKLLNITSHVGNTNQNHSEVSSHTCQNGYHQKRQQITNNGKDVRKRQLSYTLAGNVNRCSHYGKQFGGFLEKI